MTTELNNRNKIKALLNKLKIDETYTKAPKKYKYDTVKQNTFPKSDYNFMMDCMVLPETTKGFKHLLVVVDLWSDECDFEPLKNKTAITTLAAFKKIMKRPYLNIPGFSVRSDNGTEFKNSVFKTYFKENGIMHRLSLPYRHKQNGNVESLNGLLGRILMTYLQNKEMLLNKAYTEWTDIVPQLRILLNEMRKKEDGDPFDYKTPILYNQDSPKYKIGDLVHTKYEIPHDALGNREEGSEKWRKGDMRWNLKFTRKIVKIFNYPNNNRYILNGLNNVSYAETEIMKSKNKTETKIFKQILDRQYFRNKKEYGYKIWWSDQLKKNARYEYESILRPDLNEEIDKYDDENS